MNTDEASVRSDDGLFQTKSCINHAKDSHTNPRIYYVPVSFHDSLTAAPSLQ